MVLFVPGSNARRVVKKTTGTMTAYKTYRTKSTAKKTVATATKTATTGMKAGSLNTSTNASADNKPTSLNICMRSFPMLALAVKKRTGAPMYKSNYREYTEEDISEATELVHGGMSVIDAALKYGIPRATLFNRSRDGCKTHSGRCSEVFARTHSGESCKKQRSKLMQYTQESVEKAIEAVHEGMPVIDASILYRIPRATLFVRSARGCITHVGRCATVFSNGRIRRTKAPKYKYLKLLQKQAPPDPPHPQAPREIVVTPFRSVRGIPVVDATTGQIIQFKADLDVENATTGVESGHALENVDMAEPTRVFDPTETLESSPDCGTLPSSIVVKIEQDTNDEN